MSDLTLIEALEKLLETNKEIDPVVLQKSIESIKENIRIRKELYYLRDSGLHADAEETWEALPEVCQAILDGKKWSI